MASVVKSLKVRTKNIAFMPQNLQNHLKRRKIHAEALS